MVDPNKVVLSCAILTLGSTTAHSVLPESSGGLGKLPTPRLLIGTALTFMGLSMVADFAPQISTPLSMMVAGAGLTYYGIPLADNFFNQAHSTDTINSITATKRKNAKNMKVSDLIIPSMHVK